MRFFPPTRAGKVSVKGRGRCSLSVFEEYAPVFPASLLSWIYLRAKFTTCRQQNVLICRLCFGDAARFREWQNLTNCSLGHQGASSN